MKIALFEIDHYEMGYAILKTLDFNSNTITVFTTESLHIRFVSSITVSENISFVIQKDDELLEDFYERSVQTSIRNQIDVFWINTVEEKYSEFADSLSKINCKKILTIHNVNYWFNYSRFFYTKSYKANKDKINFLKQINGFVVLSKNVKDFFIQTYSPKEKVFVFPYSIYENEQQSNQEKQSSFFSIAVPGFLELARRNYDIILNCYKKLVNENNGVKLVLLGAPKGDYGLAIIEKCKAINNSGGNITFFVDQVEQVLFDKFLAETDLIISPLQPIIRREQYGKSKETGCFFDMARFAKPGVVPSYVPVPSEQSDSILHFTDENHLVELVNDLITNRDKLAKLNLKAKKNASNYTVEYIRNEPDGVINFINGK